MVGSEIDVDHDVIHQFMLLYERLDCAVLKDRLEGLGIAYLKSGMLCLV